MANRAAWIKVPNGQLEVDDGPKAAAGPGEVVVKNAYLAINPTYPGILGRDIAGEVVEVGPGVSRVRVGDRVIAYVLGRFLVDNKYNGFQLYTVAHEITLSPIPDSISLENAVVLPLAISTASAGLYQKEFLALPYPTAHPKPVGKTILVWGGSSSVGSTTIQLAVASGLTVIATSSKKNSGYVKAFGAKHALDYADEGVVEDIVSLLSGSEFVGVYDAISSTDTLKASADILHRLGGGKLVSVLPPVADQTFPSDVTVVGVLAGAIATEEKEVAYAVWGEYVPAALISGQLLPKPDPLIIKGGLSHIQEALDTLKAGVSAAKVVVEL